MQLSSFQFTNPRTTHLIFDINPKSDKTEDVSVKSTFSVNVNKFVGVNEAVVRLNIVIGDKQFASREPFFIDITIEAHFKWEDVYDEEAINELLSKNAPALLLGYARPIIANITNAGLFSSFNLPFYNFAK